MAAKKTLKAPADGTHSLDIVNAAQINADVAAWMATAGDIEIIEFHDVTGATGIPIRTLFWRYKKKNVVLGSVAGRRM